MGIKGYAAVKSQPARELIDTVCIKNGGWMISEAAVIAISGLATGQPGDVDMMERSVKVLIEHKMTEKQAKKLAEWVKNGNTPETFGQEAGKDEAKKQVFDPNDEYADYYRDLPEDGSILIHTPSKGKCKITCDLPTHQAVLIVNAIMAARKRLEMRQRPGQPATGNPFEDNMASIYDMVVQKEDKLFDGGVRSGSSNSANSGMTLVKGILDQKITTTSNNPIDQLKAKAMNAGVALLKKGVKKLWTHLKKKI